MEEYKTRKIQFRELIEINDWKVKVYTIWESKEYDSPIFYKKVISKLPAWLAMENGFYSSNHKVAFLILHSGGEGVFSVINSWVSDSMLNTNLFFTKPEFFEKPTIPIEFKKISGNGLAPCIWELEVINFERMSWIHNILKAEGDLETYLNDTIITKDY